MDETLGLREKKSLPLGGRDPADSTGGCRRRPSEPARQADDDFQTSID